MPVRSWVLAGDTADVTTVARIKDDLRTWRLGRIEAHVKLCVLALQIQRAAEMRYQQPWNRIAHALAALKAVRYRSEARTIDLRRLLKRHRNPMRLPRHREHRLCCGGET
jgi:hypothetical protein